jgi:uncharacterized membrane protein YhiD involved in acid resistance
MQLVQNQRKRDPSRVIITEGELIGFLGSATIVEDSMGVYHGLVAVF